MAEIDAREPHAEPAEQQAEQPGGEGRQRQRQQHRRRQPLRRQRRAIGAEAEIGGMAERRHAARPHDEVQAGGEQHEDQRSRSAPRAHSRRPAAAAAAAASSASAEPAAAAPAPGRSAAPPALAAVRRPACGLPSSPCGRTTSTTAMTRKTSTRVIFGRTRMPKACSSPISSAASARAGQAAEAADHHHHEGLGDDREVHVQVHRLARHLQRAAQAGQHAAEEEDRGEQPCAG